MPTIQELSTVEQLTLSDLIPLVSNTANTTRKASLNQLLQLFQSNLIGASAPTYAKTYASPSATGFSVNVFPSQATFLSANFWLILTPVAGYAAGTIVLPPVANCVDQQELIINCTQSVTTLTINGNGAVAVTGAPTTLAANGFFKLKFDALSTTWYRIG